MNPYDTYPQLWAPPMLSSLFVVKVPDSSQSLDEATYKDLMVQRVEGMIQHWIDDGNNLVGTQRLLAASLSELHPSQDYPPLNSDDLETFSLWAWRLEWAEAFIRHNHRFSEAFQLVGMNETGFSAKPVTVTDPEFDTLMAVHQETDLETWLTELTPSSWD